MTAYYNEIDAYAAQWLRNLIAAGHIAPGDVDERSIVDVSADDLKDYTQCHFFAGIGGWSHALRLSRWADTRPVWTGSCPCQPFSSAGSRKGDADERHLWPAFFHLIAELEPPVVFGEQVASKDGLEWLAGIRADLEDAGYACGAADLCAAGVGAPHIRQRIFWMADTDSERKLRRHGEEGRASRAPEGQMEGRFWERFRPLTGRGSGWDGGKSRRGPPEPHPLVLDDGFPGRLAQVRAFGNAIVPQVAAEIISAYLDAA